MNSHESQLHRLGKECFADAEGKTITLPSAPSPRFEPPRKFSIKRVQAEYTLPVGQRGRRPDIILTDNDGIKVVVEVSNKNHKGRHYFDDMDFGGFSLILKLDVSKWRDDKELRPDFSSSSMLQDVIDQCEWLSAGKARPIGWVERKLPCRTYTDEKTYEDLKRLAEEGVGEEDLKYEHIQDLGAADAMMTCFFLWRDTTPLPEYTILKLDDERFQAAQFSIEPTDFYPFYIAFASLPVYRRTMHAPGDTCPASCKPVARHAQPHRMGQVFKHWADEPRIQWKQAVDDIFMKVAPGVEPIYEKRKLQEYSE